MLIVKEYDDGIVVCGDSTTQLVKSVAESKIPNFKQGIPLIVADPPYGNIVLNDWDQTKQSDISFANWFLSWTELWATSLISGGAFYVWGGIGKPGFRPFFKYINLVEESTNNNLELSNLITWSKKRAYGVKHNYLFTREECAYFCNGNIKKPNVFNIPLLGVKRGYAGFNSKYPAKSEFKRRTNVWNDITEVMRNKIHPTQKAQRVIEIPIEVHTNPGDWVVDLFAGCGVTAVAARKLNRKFFIVENNVDYFNTIIKQLENK